MPGTWTVVKTKLGGERLVWAAYRLGRDEHGTWFFVPQGTSVRSRSDELVGTISSDGVQLVPATGWWVASWWAGGGVTVDVATPAEVSNGCVRYLDLELDLWSRDGDHGLVDEGEYEAARARGLLDEDQDEAARSTAAELGRRLGSRVEPFGEVGGEWLRRVRRNELRLVAYDPSWPARFAEVRETILPMLPAGSWVEHVGSTSVPGLAAKDCLDIAVVVPGRERFEEVIEGLESIGYEARPGAFPEDPGHVFIRRLSAGRRVQHLHLYEDGNTNLGEVLAFRDLLRADERARARYQEVKTALAAAGPYDRGGYGEGKNTVLTELRRLAAGESAQK